MADELEEIVRGLSESQRRLISEALYTNRWRLPRWSSALARKGILPVGLRSTALTTIGLRVREYLERQNNVG